MLQWQMRNAEVFGDAELCCDSREGIQVSKAWVAAQHNSEILINLSEYFNFFCEGNLIELKSSILIKLGKYYSSLCLWFSFGFVLRM